MLALRTMELDKSIDIRGREVPVFHLSSLIPYETRVSDPAGLLPEEMGEDISEGGDDDASGGAGQGGGAGVAGPAHRSSGWVG